MRPYLGPKHTVNGDVIMIIDFRAKQMMMMIEMIIDFEAEQSMGLISHRIRVDPLLGIYLMLPSVLPTSLVFSSVSFCSLFFSNQEWPGQIFEYKERFCMSQLFCQYFVSWNMLRLCLLVHLIVLYWVSQNEKFQGNRQSIILIVETVLLLDMFPHVPVPYPRQYK